MIFTIHQNVISVYLNNILILIFNSNKPNVYIFIYIYFFSKAWFVQFVDSIDNYNCISLQSYSKINQNKHIDIRYSRRSRTKIKVILQKNMFMVLILKQNNEKPPSIQLNSKFYLESIHNIHTTLVKHIMLARGGSSCQDRSTRRKPPTCPKSLTNNSQSFQS